MASNAKYGKRVPQTVSQIHPTKHWKHFYLPQEIQRIDLEKISGSFTCLRLFFKGLFCVVNGGKYMSEKYYRETI